MSQFAVQLVIGRLITDAALRRELERDGRACLARQRQCGLALTDGEIDALAIVDSAVWATAARRVEIPRWSRPASGFVARPLTRREQQVLRFVSDGFTNKQIATELRVSEAAVKATLQQLFRKAQVRTRVQLVSVAVDGALDRCVPGASDVRSEDDDSEDSRLRSR